MKIKYIDLFSGIGGFRIAAEQVFNQFGLEHECVFSSDIDIHCRESYYKNFGDYPEGDITTIDENNIPDHDILFAGFPCQPFSIIGKGKGFEDTRGTLFFDIARIIKTKRPRAFILENVKRLVSHEKGQTFSTILKSLHSLGYSVEYKILNALDYGLPQKRERIFIVGYYKDFIFDWSKPQVKRIPLDKILEKNVDKKYFASGYIKRKREKHHTPTHYPSIWHENKSGNISSYPYSCALRAGASYNYLLVNGERRLTPREMLRLQGFPDSYKIVGTDGQIRKQAGNAVPVNLVSAVLTSLTQIMLNEFNFFSINEKIVNYGK